MPLAVCATPIGNLDDVTLRVLEELRLAELVLAEDTRHTRGLLARHGITAPLLCHCIDLLGARSIDRVAYRCR